MTVSLCCRSCQTTPSQYGSEPMFFGAPLSKFILFLVVITPILSFLHGVGYYGFWKPTLVTHSRMLNPSLNALSDGKTLVDDTGYIYLTVIFIHLFVGNLWISYDGVHRLATSKVAFGGHSVDVQILSVRFCLITAPLFISIFYLQTAINTSSPLGDALLTGTAHSVAQSWSFYRKLVMWGTGVLVVFVAWYAWVIFASEKMQAGVRRYADNELRKQRLLTAEWRRQQRVPDAVRQRHGVTLDQYASVL